MQKDIVLSQKLYPLESIYATAYVYIDKCYVMLSRVDKDYLQVRLKAKPECSKADFDRVVGEFGNELLNQALRLKVAKRTEKLREAIVHRALYSAMPDSMGLDLPPEGEGDYLDDPLGIAVPWEQKFNEGAKGSDGEGK